VICRLIEEQDVGLAGQHLRKDHTELVPARQDAHGHGVLETRDVQPFQDFGGAGLGRVPIVLHHDVFEDGVLVAIELDMGVLQEFLLLLHRVEEFSIPHQYDVEDPDVLVAELVLLEPPNVGAFGDVDLPGAGLFLPCENAEDGGFAGPVGTDDSVSISHPQLDTEIGEERLGAVRLG
jgi:hypothetical protein